MLEEYWFKQEAGKPLFPDIEWSKPQTKHGAGKLLIIGGSSIGFSSVGEAYAAADSAGAGTIRTLLPDVLRPTVSRLLPEAEYAPSAPSGGFGRAALNEWLIQSHWADGVLLAGDLGRNSETAMLLESFVEKYDGLLTIAKDTADYFMSEPRLLVTRPATALVISIAQLQKLGTALKVDRPFLLSMGLMLTVQALHDFTLNFPEVVIVTKELDYIIVAHNGRVSTTKTSGYDKWRVRTAAALSVYWMQNRAKPFEAVSASLLP